MTVVLGVLVWLIFMVTTSASCPAEPTLLQGNGSFSLSPYNNNMTCSWTLQAVPGEKVILSFHSFSTKKCCDYVKIREGSSTGPVIAIFSGHDLPPDVISCKATMHVTFRSGSKTTSLGFTASFRSQGYFTSPGFPRRYTNGERKRWIVCGLPSSPLCLYFSTFHTEKSSDFLTIARKNGSSIGLYSGSAPPPDITSTSHLNITFISHSFVVKRGFRAEFCTSTCETLTAPVNGVFSSNLHNVGSVVRLTCRRGYRNVGPLQITCLPSGVWSSNLSRCERASCLPPPSVAHGQFQGTSFYPGNTVQLVCDSGYYIAGGKDKFRCSFSGVWNGRSRMNCYPVGCGEPRAPNYGTFSGSDYYLNSVVTFRCNAGYDLKGPNSSTCLATAQWSDRPPSCTASKNHLTPEAKILLKGIQDEVFDPLTTFTEAAQPPLGSEVSTANLKDFIVALDLVFVLDTSGSIGEKNFSNIKTFAINIVQPFVMNNDATHVAAIAFGSEVYVISQFTSSKSVFLNALSSFEYKGGGTKTGEALLKAKQMFGASPRNTERLKRMLILVTDGRSNGPKRPELVAKDLNHMSVDRLTIGIGKRINESELNSIASPPSNRHVFMCSSFTVFREFADSIRPRPINQSCGIAGAPGFHTRVLNGDISMYGAWPWLASIYIKESQKTDSTLTCGGSLISKQWVVTAAHCVFRYQWNTSVIRVKLGDHYRRIPDRYEQTFTVLKLIIGADSIGKPYDPFNHDNDIALIQLNRPAVYNNYVRAICFLRPIYRNSAVMEPGERATVVGWGVYQEGSKSWSESPREATVTIHNITRCEGGSVGRSLTSDMLCTKGTDTDACYGDSGGPLMCQLPRDYRFILCGIVSFGKQGDCQKHGFGVYTKVYNYLSMINQKVAP